MKKSFNIKEGYIHRDVYNHFDDTPNEAGYQDQIYDHALELMKKNNFSKVLDIGTGSGYKLMNKFKKYKCIGTEIEPTLSWLKNKYPTDEWIESNFTKPPTDKFDIVICADVIEHLLDPDMLLNYIDSLDFKLAIISSPERNSTQMAQMGYLSDGPPQNETHMREWSFDEFKKYLSIKFEVCDHQLTRNPAENVSICQMIVVKKKN